MLLDRDGTQHWRVLVREAGPGTRYGFLLDDDPKLYPDPGSRSQPDGPHGASEVIDPRAFTWSDHEWRGRALRDAVFYEMHVGTFTRAGTWRAAAEHLRELADVGITVIEMMPVTAFPGRFGWGYDGVSLFAPYAGYGRPDDLRRFVDHAHGLGLAVILDVVYNHLGPDGNYLPRFSPSFSSDRYETDWGLSPRFDGPGCEPVRELVIANARFWIDEYRFDGLRLDATQDIYDFDADHEHLVSALARAVRDAAPERTTLVIGENEPQRVELVRPRDEGGMGLDALWNDDFHHSATVALTGRDEAYYRDYTGSAQEIASALKHGFLYQGQRYAWQSQRRGTATFDVDPTRFVAYLQNHDQVANSLDGRRVHQLTCPAKYRALLSLVLLGPATPLLFQGEEFLASAPFLYFADHEPALAACVRKGRGEFLAQFPSVAQARARLSDPAALETFERSKLDHAERTRNASHVDMVRTLLALRREDRTIAGDARVGLDAAALSDPAQHALVLRYFGSAPDHDRLLVVNLGPSRHLASCSEPLCAPPFARRWRDAFSSEDPRWGGRGATPTEQDDGWHLTADSTALLVPEPDPTPRFGPPEKKRSSDTTTSTEERR
ncbi:Malto-oligosyltrehalose trehalohydrolase [Sandaracinus amylolyticus]|uniref:Malto-oligosyltrehalose trehalohydrolase n=1 Tax=Sandaracinus amylolyticus TaxID=927083 RepID=A0A0F6SH11_9BACT|nr:Malto-oligosyltrehalose trehalohydrolase [Sandaracinus amylolyticus]